MSIGSNKNFSCCLNKTQEFCSSIKDRVDNTSEVPDEGRTASIPYSSVKRMLVFISFNLVFTKLSLGFPKYQG